MGAKVALAALIGAGLLIVSVATAHAVRLEPSVERPGAAAGTGSPRAPRLDCAEAVTGGHQAWSTASWLVGLSLIVAISRRNPARLAA